MGCVYLLGEFGKDNIYKIGVTRGDVDKRIKKLQTGNSGAIYVVKTFETDHPFMLEKMLHLNFAGKKVMNEWYELSTEDVLNFKETCRKFQKSIDSLKHNTFLINKTQKH